MGDRCYLRLYWNKADTEELKNAFEEIFGCTLEQGLHEIEEDGEEVTGTCDEANYGWYDPLKELAKKGIVFHGWHSEGGEYGACQFCSWNGEYSETDVTHDCVPFVEVDNDGQINYAFLEMVRKHLVVWRSATDYCQTRKAIAA